MGKQLLRSGTFVAANYREVWRGRSLAETIAKLGIVEQEIDETILWFELLCDADIVSTKRMQPIMQEEDELLSILVTSINRLKEKF